MWRIVWIRRSGLVYPCPYPANLWININSPIPSACFGAVAALRYLFDIVANQHSGVDVDKFDYLARDSHHLGVKLSFDHRQTMQAFKVWVGGWVWVWKGLEGRGGEGRTPMHPPQEDHASRVGGRIWGLLKHRLVKHGFKFKPRTARPGHG